jgi:hypothetical protein
MISPLAVAKQLVEKFAEPGFKNGDLDFGGRHVLVDGQHGRARIVV